MNNTQYIAMSPLDKPSVSVRFEGMFNNHSVEWFAEICSTRFAQLNQPEKYNQPLQFIDISIIDKQHFIRVGLSVDIVCHADILKTVIMVQRYKRLGPGLHWFGQNLKQTKL